MPNDQPTDIMQQLYGGGKADEEPSMSEQILNGFLERFIKPDEVTPPHAQSFDEYFSKTVSPARNAVANIMMGMGAGLTGQRFQSVREQRLKQWQDQQQQAFEEKKLQQQKVLEAVQTARIMAAKEMEARQDAAKQQQDAIIKAAEFDQRGKHWANQDYNAANPPATGDLRIFETLLPDIMKDKNVTSKWDAYKGFLAAQEAAKGKTPNRDDQYIAIKSKPKASWTPEETSFVAGFDKWVDKTKVEPGVLRIDALAETRGIPMLDTKNGNAPVLLNWNDINTAQQKEPGRYMPASTSVPALNKTALMEDIRGNVQQVRDSLAAMPNFDTMDKAKISIALRSRDPRSSISALISGGAMGSLTSQQQEYLIRVTNLVENAMAMRSVLGAGQGSEDLRSAITATIPGPTTPNKNYALKQLDIFERVLDRLERGVPKVPLRTDLGGGTGGVPTVGGTFNGEKVLKVKKVK